MRQHVGLGDWMSGRWKSCVVVMATACLWPRPHGRPAVYVSRKGGSPAPVGLRCRSRGGVVLGCATTAKPAKENLK